MTWDANAFKTWLQGEWQAHTKMPAQVAANIARVLTVESLDDSQVLELSALACHIYAEHLGDWAAGLRYYAQLWQRYPTLSGECTSRLARQAAILQKAADASYDIKQFTQADQHYITALAVPAATLCGNMATANELYLAMKQSLAVLGETPQAMRLTAVVIANLSCDLLERYTLSLAQQELLRTLRTDGTWLWQRVGDATDQAKAAYRSQQVDLVLQRPAGYGSGRYPRYASIAP